MIFKFGPTQNKKDIIDMASIPEAYSLQALDYIGEAIAFIDKNHILLWGNKALWTLYSIPEEVISDYIGKSWINLYTPQGQQEIIDNVFPAVQKNDFWSGESYLRTKNGAVIRAQFSLRKTEYGYLGTARDISERYKIETDRENISAQIYQDHKIDMIEKSIRILMHDFSNSLSSVTGYAEMLREDLERFPDLHKFADKIYMASLQLSGLVKKVRHLMPRRRLEEKKSTDIIALMPVAMAELKCKSDIDLKIDFKTEFSSVTVACDENTLGHLLKNILQNAIESSPDKKSIFIECMSYDGGLDTQEVPNEELFYQLKSTEESVKLYYGFFDPLTSYVHIKIDDEGEGMSLEIMQNIFNPFFTTRKSGSQAGLGMSIVRSAVKKLGGFLQIESIEGFGTSVNLLLPLDMEGVLPQSTT